MTPTPHAETPAPTATRSFSICLFGLSADPPTIGHVGIVRALRDRNEWDEIWILPVYRHTFAEKRLRLVSFDHRWNMCQAAFAAELASSSSTTTTRVILSDAESLSWKYANRFIAEDDDDKAKNGAVGTAALLDYLSATYDGTGMSFSVCVGADAFLDLTAGLWKESDRILSFFADTDTSSPSPLSVPPNYRRAASSNRQLLVLHRSSSPANESPAGATNNNGSSVEAQEKQKNDDLVLARRVQDTAGSRLIRIGSLGSISSSQVRACLDTEQLTRVVVPSILEYIQRNHLYQFSVE